MTRASWCLVAAGLLASCRAGDGPAAPANDVAAPNALVTHFRDRIFFTNDLVVADECTGEDVLLHLRQMFAIHEVDQVGKAFHGHLTFLDRGTTGVGLTSGAIYRQTGAEKQDIVLRARDPHVVNSVVVGLNLVGQGRVPNLTVHQTFHVTITPAGVASVTLEKIRQHCRGS